MLFDDVLLTVDFDRTLTAPDSTIPERNIAAIRYFMDNGGTFTVNTGRSVNTFRRHMDTIPVNAPFLLYNGSAAYEKGKLKFCRPIDLDMWATLKTMRQLFPALNLEVQSVNTHYLIDAKPSYEAYYDAIGWGHTSAQWGQDLGVFLKFALFGDAKQSNTVGDMFLATPEEEAYFSAAQAKIMELYGDKVDVCRAAPRIIDVQAKGVSKIQAARDLQARLGKRILICVGDAENDLTMLEGADYAFCPSDGVVADRFPNVCPCAQGAVADVIYEKIPQILKNKP